MVIVFNLFAPKMSKVAMTELPMEGCLLDLPYEILFDIFRRLPINKLSEISELCLKFRNVAGDTRFWKNVIVRYQSYDETKDATIFAFEELYSGPWPVKEIDLQHTKIEPPVSWKTDQVVKVTRLNLSMIAADKVTLEAILAKYQCTEICFNCNTVDPHGRIEGIAPETFSKQTALEMLSLMFVIRHNHYSSEVLGAPQNLIQLLPNLSNCKNLKTLYFYAVFDNLDLPGFAKNLPSFIEKLSIEYLECLEDPYHNLTQCKNQIKLLYKNEPKHDLHDTLNILIKISRYSTSVVEQVPNCLCDPKSRFNHSTFPVLKLLAESVPNLRELVLTCPASVKCPSLLEFQFLEALKIYPCDYHNVSDLNMYLIKFPALKTVDIGRGRFHDSEINHVELAETLTPHGIIVRPVDRTSPWPDFRYQPEDGNVWKVSKKAM